MEASQLFDDFVAGAYVQVVGVGQLHLGFDLFQILCGYGSLDGSHGSHIHEHGGLYGSVYGFKFSSFCSSFLFQQTVHSFSPLFFHGRRFPPGPAAVRRRAELQRHPPVVIRIRRRADALAYFT